MEALEKQEGVAFLLVFFTGRNEILYLPLRHLRAFWERREQGGRKSFRYEELDLSYRISMQKGVFIPYLEMIQKDLDER